MTPKSSAGPSTFIQTSKQAVKTGKQTQNLSESKTNTLLHFHIFEIQHIHLGYFLDKKQLPIIMTAINCYYILFKNTAVKSRSCQSFEFLLENNGHYFSSVDGTMTNMFFKYKGFNFFECYSPALEQGI